MTATKRKLPSFRKPPLAEVALGVQWEPLPAIGVHHLGLLWERFAERFPNVEHHGELSPMMERAGTPPASEGPHILFGRAEMPRLWFLDKENRELLQIQKDRFSRNWRKLQSEDIYPRYDEHIRPSFEADLSYVADFFRERGVGDLTPNQCEVVYVNHIEPGVVWSTHDELEHIFANGINVPTLSSGLVPTQGQFEFVYSLNDENGDFMGRLRISCTPGFRDSDRSPIYQLRLAARGWPLTQDIPGALAFLDLGRKKIVESFAELTSSDMHQVWEREDV